MNELDKDKAAIAKDIGALAAEVSLKSAELKELNRAIQAAKDERVRQEKLTSPLVLELDSRIIERKRELERMEQQIKHTENLTRGNILSLNSELQALYAQKAKLELKVNNITENIVFLSNAEVEVGSRVGLLTQQIPALEASAEVGKRTIEELNKTIKEKTERLADLKKEEARIDDAILAVRKEEGNVANYRHDLEKIERDLDLRDNEISVMEERLTPEYKKEFGKFHNLINGKQK